MKRGIFVLLVFVSALATVSSVSASKASAKTDCPFQSMNPSGDSVFEISRWLKSGGMINHHYLHYWNADQWAAVDILKDSRLPFAEGGVVQSVISWDPAGGGIGIVVGGTGSCSDWHASWFHLPALPKWGVGEKIGAGEIIANPGCTGFDCDSIPAHNHTSLFYCGNEQIEGVVQTTYVGLFGRQCQFVDPTVYEPGTGKSENSKKQSENSANPDFVPVEDIPFAENVSRNGNSQIKTLADLPYIVDQRAAVAQVFPVLNNCADIKPVQIVWHQIAVASLNDPQNMDGTRLAKAFLSYYGWDRPGYSVLIGYTEKDGKAVTYQLANTNCATYGVGPSNNWKSINISFVDYPAGSKPTDFQLKTMLELSQILMQEYGINAENVFGHREVCEDLNGNGIRDECHADPVGVDMDWVRKYLGANPAPVAAVDSLNIPEIRFAEAILPQEVIEKQKNMEFMQEQPQLSSQTGLPTKFKVFGSAGLVVVALVGLLFTTSEVEGSRITGYLVVIVCVLLLIYLIKPDLPAEVWTRIQGRFR
jgi:hypothetical protein